MRIPQIDPKEAAYHLRIVIDDTGYNALPANEKSTILYAVKGAESYVSAQTGLKTERVSGVDDDANDDLRYAVLCVAGDMYDTRNYSGVSETLNQAAKYIIAQHSYNLLPKE